MLEVKKEEKEWEKKERFKVPKMINNKYLKEKSKYKEIQNKSKRNWQRCNYLTNFKLDKKILRKNNKIKLKWHLVMKWAKFKSFRIQDIIKPM